MFARLIVVFADQAPTSNLEQAENAPGSKSSSTTAFFDSIGQTQKSQCATGKSALPSTTVIVSQTCQVRKVPISVSASMPGQDPDHVLGPADSLRGDRNLPSLDMRASERVARPQYWYGIGHVAARSKRTRRNVALYSCARRHVLSTECILSLVGARSIDRGQRMLELWNNWSTPWPRRRRLPPSSSLSWWLPALLRWRKVGGDKRVRQKVDLGETSANRSFRPA
jgi:hypothetical protein